MACPIIESDTSPSGSIPLTPMSDPRIDQARQWLATVQTRISSLGWSLDPDSLMPASSDASFRRYFRLQATHNGQASSLILMDAPPDREDIRPFIEVAGLMEQAGVHVPHIWDQDSAMGFLLCADLGHQTYAARLAENPPSGEIATMMQDAWRALIRLQLHPGEHLAPYDEARMTQEMKLFDEWYLKRHLGHHLSAKEQQALGQTIQLILDQCLGQPCVIVHRDYHSRNLMVTKNDPPGILDFQDAVFGPITYDLVSLLRDAYIDWPEELQIDWAVRYWKDARDAGLAVAADFGEFWRDFEWMGLQRHLKVLGIFARLHHRDGKDGYLKDIPLVRRHALSVARRYQGLGPLAHILERAA